MVVVQLEIPALGIILCLHFTLNGIEVLADIGLFCQHFDLELYRRNLHPTCEAGDDVLLLGNVTEQEVDRLHLDHTEIATICSLDNAVSDISDRDEVLCVERLLFFATDDLCLLALWGFFTGLRFFRFLGFSLILIPNCSGGLGADIPDTAFIGFSGASGTGVSDRYSVLRWMSQRTQLTANSESESPSNPITPKIPSGRDTRHK